MLDHMSLGVTDLDRSRAFYDKVLASLGYRRIHDLDTTSGWGADAATVVFWVGYPLDSSATASPCPGTHVAFTAANRAAVDSFYAAAIAAGGKDNGKPGIRPEYHENYYGGFVLDPDGHAIEAVCHKAE